MSPQDGRNLMSAGPADAHGLAPEAEHFLAGILGHLPGLLAFLAASPNSYRRLAPSTWSGAFQVSLRDHLTLPIPWASKTCSCNDPKLTKRGRSKVAIASSGSAG